jgi:hypothetical protein
VITDEAGEAIGVICPDCLTPDEEQAMIADYMSDLEDQDEADLRAWLTGWLAKQPSYDVKIRARPQLTR